MSNKRMNLPMASRLSPDALRLPLITPDKFHDECAVFGIYGHKEAANLTYLGLYALQHRGQEGSGIVSSDGEHFHLEKAMGLVADIYTKRSEERRVGKECRSRWSPYH